MLVGIRRSGALLVALLMAACGGGGAGNGDGQSVGTGGTITTPAAPNKAPSAMILASGQVFAAQAGSANLQASVGSEVSLSGASSTDPDSDILTFKWTLQTRPTSSRLALASDSTAIISFTPDVIGSYEFSLRVTDAKGAFADKAVAILVDNAAPTPVVVIAATYTAVPTVRPTQVVTVGASILLDASNSTDPNGDPVTTTWTLTTKPAGSAAALQTNANTTRFAADIKGVYRVTARAQDPYGAYAETVYVLDAQNLAPNAVLLANIGAASFDNGQTSLNASIGYDVVLSSASSIDPEGDAIASAWVLVSKPATSTALLTAASGTTTRLTPDVRGAYVVRVTVTDPSGAASFFTATINVNNNRPLAVIGTNATPIALPSGPTVRLPPNTQVTLRGTGSSDADGDAMTYAWSITSAPAGSSAGLSSTSASVVQFTPALAGNYFIRLRVTDPAGAYSEGELHIAIGNYPPAAVLDKDRVTVLAGATVVASAALSFDEDGDALTYQWSIDARPAGSTATIASPNTSALTFTPDLPGTYTATVTVNDGTHSSLGHVVIRALSTVSGSVALPFVPLSASYSRGLDKLVIHAANPNAVHLVDPFVGSRLSVVLPAAVKSMQLSPDGKLAAVLHEGLVSLIDLTTMQLLRTSSTAGSQTDVFVLNDGIAYLIGQTGGQWVQPGVAALNLRTGAAVELQGVYGSAFFYGTQKGVLADRKNRVLFMAYGLSPADISYFDFNPTTHAVTTSGDSPYHGDWPLGARFYLSWNQDLLFTSAGTYFNTETLRYAGTFGLPGAMLSMSHSSIADEALVLQQTTANYPAAYHRFYGALFLADGPIALPTIGGQQSYGLELFHSANGNHVAIVQTGSDAPLAPGLQYHVIYR